MNILNAVFSSGCTLKRMKAVSIRRTREEYHLPTLSLAWPYSLALLAIIQKRNLRVDHAGIVYLKKSALMTKMGMCVHYEQVYSMTFNDSSAAGDVQNIFSMWY